MTPNDVLDEFRSAGALLEGHFVLSSGLHSPVFLQKMFVFQDPARTERVCRALAEQDQGERSELSIMWSPLPRRHRSRLRDGPASRLQGDLRRARERRFRAAPRLHDSGRRSGGHGGRHRDDRAFLSGMPDGPARASRNDPRRRLPDRPLGRQSRSRRAPGFPGAARHSGLSRRPAAARAGGPSGRQTGQPKPEIINSCLFVTR